LLCVHTRGAFRLQGQTQTQRPMFHDFFKISQGLEAF
jgi:hypothetical protein